MTHRERALAVLRYEAYDRLPIVHFGFWEETLVKWHQEGHLTLEEMRDWKDGNPADQSISAKLGFDFDWASTYDPNCELFPAFEEIVLETLPDGGRKVRDKEGVVVLKKDDAISIPTEIDHLLKTREDWEREYLPRLQYADERLKASQVNVNAIMRPFYEGGLAYLQQPPAQRELPVGLYCGSLIGRMRNIVGLVELSYLAADDPGFYAEIIDAFGHLAYTCVERVLASGAQFDFAHFWEDICYRSGPLVNPKLFREKVAPHYRRITDLLRQHDITIVSVDCDGKIDKLVPIWLEHGVNTMFPIEVGTWGASIAPWRQQYGTALLGVGGMNKTVFAHDRAAIDSEIERLKPLIELGGYIPCPDHRIAPDAKWDNVRYYCDRMRAVFGA
ncbi:hypothetical protein U14_02912 [Candidatus Moduliflexus flocculans]|uniref:Uncharacterized protein n=1 Tax=Candidatus Moduliflexus flocculans TaxID=1499966 RepID=A0A081BMQ1_9BACT|nr:hypothetical protein U14_02912 [Candidatus Moduliflexus flocculans]